MLFYIAIFFIPLSVWIILRAVSKRRAKDETELPTLLEVCALCHEEFEMSELIEKEVGEYGRFTVFVEDALRACSMSIANGRKQIIRVNM